MSDVKLRVSTSMQGSKQGRNVAKAVGSTGKYLSDTGKNVRSFMSTWWAAGQEQDQEDDDNKTPPEMEKNRKKASKDNSETDLAASS